MSVRCQRLGLSLPKKGIFTLPDAHGVDIECHSGSLWITLDHDLRDIVLSPGQRFRSEAHSRALVGALEPSCVRFMAPRLAISAQSDAPEASPSTAHRGFRGMSPA